MEAYKSEIVAVIDDKHSDDLDAMVKTLTKAGCEVSNVNRSEGVIEGLVDSGQVKAIDDLPGVEYVRTVFTYLANHAPANLGDRDEM